MIASTNTSTDYNMLICRYIFITWTCAHVLLLPVFMFVIGVGFQRCWQPRSRSPATTHSDVFTVNMAAFEVLLVLTNCLNVASFRIKNVLKVVENVSAMITLGQILLHTLVCLERYLAVVHPILYLRLKKNGDVIRNVSIAIVWLSSLGLACTYHLSPVLWLILFITAVFSLVSANFFCASALHVLIRPGPGETGGDRKRVDQSKLRAFHTIAAVTVALFLKFVTTFITYMIFFTDAISDSNDCVMMVCSQWFSIPSSLAMPLLFLYRRAKQRKMTSQ